MLFNLKDSLKSLVFLWNNEIFLWGILEFIRSSHCLNALSMRIFLAKQKLFVFLRCLKAEEILALLTAPPLAGEDDPCSRWPQLFCACGGREECTRGEWLWLFPHIAFFSRWCSKLQVVVACGKLLWKVQQTKLMVYCPAVSFPPSTSWWSVSRALLANSSCWLKFLSGLWYFKFKNLQIFKICLWKKKRAPAT